MQGRQPGATSALHNDTYAPLSSVLAQYVFWPVKHEYRKGLYCISELQPFCWPKYTFHSISLPWGDGTGWGWSKTPGKDWSVMVFSLWKILGSYSEAGTVSRSPNTVLFCAAIMILLKNGATLKVSKLHIFCHFGCYYSELKRTKESIQSTSAANASCYLHPCAKGLKTNSPTAEPGAVFLQSFPG